MKKIFITGSTGLLGKSICKIFKNHYKILKISNNTKVKNKRSIKYLNYSNSKEILKFVKKNGIPDYFIHAGWGKMNEPNSNFHIKENVDTSKKLIRNFFHKGLRNFIFVGTINEYGNNKGIVSEKRKSLGNLRNYEKGKIIVGKFGKKIANRKQTNFIHLRIANLFGPIKKKQSLIYSMHISNKRKKNVEVSSLKFYRDYLHVDTVSKYILSILSKLNKSIILNIGSGRKILMRKFVFLYWKILNKNKNKIIFKKDDLKLIPKGFYMSIKKLRNISGEKLNNDITIEIRNNIKLLNK